MKLLASTPRDERSGSMQSFTKAPSLLFTVACLITERHLEKGYKLSVIFAYKIKLSSCDILPDFFIPKVIYPKILMLGILKAGD